MRAHIKGLATWVVTVGGTGILAAGALWFMSVSSTATSADERSISTAADIRVMKRDAENEREWRLRMERNAERLEYKVDVLLRANGVSSKDLEAFQ